MLCDPGEREPTREERFVWGGRGCHGEISQRAGGEQRCLQDDCRCSQWSKPFSLTCTPGLTQTETGGRRGDRGCRAFTLVITRDLLPACLPVCLNADPCHPLQTRDCFFKQNTTQTGAYACRHRQNTHKEIHMHQNLLREREG